MFTGKHTEKTKKKISLTSKQRWQDPEYKKRVSAKISKNKKGKPGGHGKTHWNWKGGITIKNGYAMIHYPKHPNATKHGYIRRSWSVIERHNNIILPKGSTVHHINGNKLDDRIENLRVYTNSQHRKFHVHIYDFLVEQNLITEYFQWLRDNNICTI